MDKMPHGIVDKQVAGIGATSLEIDSKRNSIIVFPTKILAYNKWQRNKTKLLYVGGKINDERDTCGTDARVKKYVAFTGMSGNIWLMSLSLTNPITINNGPG